jgi:radical SAM superfamily enzyme YgiQ (UPF0313 family)
VDIAVGLGFERVTFVDENFIGPGRVGRRHATDLAAELRRRSRDVRFNFGCRPNDVDLEVMADLQRSGLAGVSIGVESMAGPTLDLFNKKTTPEVNEAAVGILERLGLPTEITFIFFHPLSTLAELRENASFVERVRRSPTAYFNNGEPFTEFIPFFGTPMTELLIDRGLARRDLDGYSVSLPTSGWARSPLASPASPPISSAACATRCRRARRGSTPSSARSAATRSTST